MQLTYSLSIKTPAARESIASDDLLRLRACVRPHVCISFFLLSLSLSLSLSFPSAPISSTRRNNGRRAGR